ncbi:translation initiation factor eIF4A [Ceratobasidium sp. 428]|nr:translation initiation factor eIF4A [Ceratobasidium sp. 428]
MMSGEELLQGRILVEGDELTLEGMRQFYVQAEKEEWKLDELCDLYETWEAIATTQVIIFCSDGSKVNWLAKQHAEREFTVSSVHSDMEHKTREAIVKEFFSGSSLVLITNDLPAGDISVQQVSLVINYDLPADYGRYIYRIGRSGRSCRTSVAINFVTADEMQKLREIEQFYNTQIVEIPVKIAEFI